MERCVVQHNPDFVMIERLASELKGTVREVLGGRRRVALVDFPLHDNVGDSAIWLGQRALMRELELRCVYAATASSYNAQALKTTRPEVILISGGGNFGDLYTHHEELRRQVLTDFPLVPVVQLPQSIHYQRPESAEQMRRLVARHSSFTVLCRDQRSMDFSLNVLQAQAHLAPDAAFALGPLQPVKVATAEWLYLRRSDGEAVSGGTSGLDLPDCEVVTDWHDPQRVRRGIAPWRIATAIQRMPRVGPINAPVLAWFDRMAAAELQRGVDILSQGESVLTDRLHAHILSVLLGKQNLLLDNSYGKLAGFHEMWTAESRLARKLVSAG